VVFRASEPFSHTNLEWLSKSYCKCDSLNPDSA
jgi:hypothetical protein